MSLKLGSAINILIQEESDKGWGSFIAVMFGSENHPFVMADSTSICESIGISTSFCPTQPSRKGWVKPRSSRD
ncbi:hypothetical protein SERLA73DRAFT_184398, partial [Serpula lacrymans var. lacrymans S7.3]